MGKNILKITMAVTGLGLTMLAVFAQQLGVARSSDWGPGRKIVAGTGLVLILIMVLIFAWPFWQRIFTRVKNSLNHLWRSICDIPFVQKSTLATLERLSLWKEGWGRWPPVSYYRTNIRPGVKNLFARISSSPPIRYCTASEDRKAVSVAVVLGTLVVLIYVWFASVGFWVNWPKTTSYYQQLSDAFRQGQVSLLVQPDPALLRLADPYTYANRQNISYPWDVVFYQGKFYLYWGPAPALVILITRPFSSIEIGDQKLVFFFVTGIFLISTLFILRLRIKFFPSLGWPYVIPAILLAGLANPLPWLLNRPAVYEAAIASGQFFLLSGLFFGYLACEQKKFELWKLVLSSACLLLAVASRASLAFAAVFLVLLISGYVAWVRGHWVVIVSRLSAFLLPFFAGIVTLGWYNRLRFGNWLEFGFKYQLTGMNTHINTFSLANLPINLHNYFLNPYRLLPTFPYIKPILGGHFIFFPIASPSNYYSEQVTGLLITTPFILFAGIPIFYLIWFAWNSLGRIITKAHFNDNFGDGFFRWTAFAMTGGAFLAFAPILIYIAGMMRFLGDTAPLIILASVFGFFMGSRYLEGKKLQFFWFNSAVIALILYSILASLLLAVTGAEARFEHLNPALFDMLTRLFTP